MGTMEFDVRNLDNWQIAVCSRCCRFLEDVYFVHQCQFRIPHRWCYHCLVEKGDCHRCGVPYAMILNPFQCGVNQKDVILSIGEIQVVDGSGLMVDESLVGDWDWNMIFGEDVDQPECEYCRECDECARLAEEEKALNQK